MSSLLEVTSYIRKALAESVKMVHSLLFTVNIIHLSNSLERCKHKVITGASDLIPAPPAIP